MPGNAFNIDPEIMLQERVQIIETREFDVVAVVRKTNLRARIESLYQIRLSFAFLPRDSAALILFLPKSE